MSFERRELEPWEVETTGPGENAAVRIVCGTCRYRLAGSMADNCITTVMMLMAEGLPRHLQDLIYRASVLRDLSNTQIIDLRLKLLDPFGGPLQLIEDADLDTAIENIVVQNEDGTSSEE